MSDPSPIRICAAQISSIWEDPERTLEKAGLFVRHAAASGADLICFPEQFATGWDPLPEKNVQDINGPIVTTRQRCAEKNRIMVIGSFRERGDLLPRNTAVVIGRDGSILATYAKIHLFSPGKENAGTAAGSGLGIFRLGSLTCGIAICYDLRFPELFRLYGKRGVQVVFVPAAWPELRARHWELFIQARALENQMYVIGVNTTGTTPVETYAGGTMAADPQGTVLCRAGRAEELVFLDLDFGHIASCRSQFPAANDRRDDLYTLLS